MRIVIASLNVDIVEISQLFFQRKFSNPNIEIISDYNKLKHIHNNEDVDLFVIDVALKYNEALDLAIGKEFIDNYRDKILSSPASYIFLSGIKDDFVSVNLMASERVMFLRYSKTHEINQQKINKEFKCFVEKSPLLRRHIALKNKIFFIHGFLGSESTWDNYIHLIKSDDELKHTFETEAFPYNTFSFSISKLILNFKPRKYAKIEDLSLSLKSYVTTSNYDNYFLVGHSLGCLIIRKFLIQNFSNKEILPHKVLLYAPPNRGSLFATILGFIFRNNSHLKALSIGSWFLRKLNKEWNDRDVESFIKIKAIVALQDKTVNTKSSRYCLRPENVECYHDKGHINIKSPGDHNSHIYKSFKNYVMEN